MLHSHSQLLGFQINHLQHLPISTNSLHLHLHFSLFQRCLLLRAFAFNLQIQLQVLCYSICLVSLVSDIRLNISKVMFSTTSRTHNIKVEK